MKQKYIIYILVLVALVIIYFFVANNSKQEGFKQSFQHAKDHIENIDVEIINSEEIIYQAKLRLDSMEENVLMLKQKKQKNLKKMQETKIKLERLVNDTENEIIIERKKYAELNNKKKLYEFKLDSLASQIQNIF